MASLIGPAIGIASSLFGGSKSKSADKQAAQQALTGYNYLTSGAGGATIRNAQNNGSAASTAQSGTQNAEAQLLGTAPMQPGTANGFNNYLNSTGYQFTKDQGTSALTGSAAARGILNSGNTAKSLQTFGQNTASTGFNNYLNSLKDLSTQQGSAAAQGVNAAQVVGQAGTGGGAGAAEATHAGGISTGNSIVNAGTQLTKLVGDGSGISNFFGSL